MSKHFAAARLVVGSPHHPRRSELELLARPGEGWRWWWFNKTAGCWVGATLDGVLKLYAGATEGMRFDMDGETWEFVITEPCSDAVRRELDVFTVINKLAFDCGVERPNE